MIRLQVAAWATALDRYPLLKDVISCQEAALAKRIMLENELKTLILHTSEGVRALHIRGDRFADLRKVKREMKVKEAKLLSPGELERRGLTPGTVSPILQVVWSMPHLISSSISSLDFVSTNDGTRSGYVIFDPLLLQSAQDFRVGNYERERTS